MVLPSEDESSASPLTLNRETNAIIQKVFDMLKNLRTSLFVRKMEL